MSWSPSSDDFTVSELPPQMDELMSDSLDESPLEDSSLEDNSLEDSSNSGQPVKVEKHTGFYDYQKTGKFTTTFLEDFEKLTEKIYRHWTLAISFEDFHGSCLEKLVRRIGFFDPKLGKISTFLYSMINYEAWRIASSEKRLANNVDYDFDTLVAPDAEDVPWYERHPSLVEFSELARSRGFWLDGSVMASLLDSGSSCSAVKVYSWWQRRGGCHAI